MRIFGPCQVKCLKSLSRKLHSSSISRAIEVKMPSLSPTMTEGTIISWAKTEGDRVSAGDVLCEIQTDKAVLPLEIDEEGVLAKILVPSNSTDVKIGTPIAVIAEEGEDWKVVASTANHSASAEPSAVASEAVAEFSSFRHLSAVPQLIGPAVRGLLEMHGIDATKIKGSGPRELILKGDVLNYVKQHNLKPVNVQAHETSARAEQHTPSPTMPTSFTMAPAIRSVAESQLAKAVSMKAKKPTSVSEFSDIELTNIRKIIARRLTESKGNIPHAYGSVDCAVDDVLRLRATLKKEGINVSLNDFVIKAVAIALELVPEVNVTMVDGESRRSSNVDISVAVATDNGLITPIVKDANGLGIQEISETVKELAARARINKLKPHEFQGGSFSISNLGMYGVSEFSAIINPPQCAILAVGSGRLAFDELGQPQNRMAVTLSYDSRAISATDAARFLEILKDLISSPSYLLLGNYEKKSVAFSE